MGQENSAAKPSADNDSNDSGGAHAAAADSNASAGALAAVSAGAEAGAAESSAEFFSKPALPTSTSHPHAKLPGQAVSLYVWLPTMDGGIETGQMKQADYVEAHTTNHVGHASLGTAKTYASFWPEKDPKAIQGLFSVRSKFQTFDEDVAAEKREPDVVAVLYGNSDLIDRAFESFAESPAAEAWSLMGANWCNKLNGGRGQSCAGLVYWLLCEGGRDEGWEAFADVCITPDMIARFAKEATESQCRERIPARFTQPKGITSLDPRDR